MLFDGEWSLGIGCYSPLTFCYTLSDLIRRGGIRNPSALMQSFFCGLPPVFQKNLDTIQEWMGQRPVWKVKVAIPFSVFDSSAATPVLRLVLVPTSDFFAGSLSDSTNMEKFLKMDSTTSHFIDNVELDLKLKPEGGIDQVEISFLLADRSLLETHCGIVVNQPRISLIFVIGRFGDRRCRVEPFDSPFPWTMAKPSNRPASSGPSASHSEMIAKSCQETEVAYTIRFKISLVKKSKAPSG